MGEEIKVHQGHKDASNGLKSLCLVAMLPTKLGQNGLSRSKVRAPMRKWAKTMMGNHLAMTSWRIRVLLLLVLGAKKERIKS